MSIHDTTLSTAFPQGKRIFRPSLSVDCNLAARDQFLKTSTRLADPETARPGREIGMVFGACQGDDAGSDERREYSGMFHATQGGCLARFVLHWEQDQAVRKPFADPHTGFAEFSDHFHNYALGRSIREVAMFRNLAVVFDYQHGRRPGETGTAWAVIFSRPTTSRKTAERRADVLSRIFRALETRHHLFSDVVIEGPTVEQLLAV